VLPYFKKAERFEPGGDDSRGTDGPLNVTHMVERAELLDAFIDAAAAEGFPRNNDYNNGRQEGFGYYQVTQKNGARWSTARGFLDPIRDRPNLRIETNAYTTKVILDGKRAVGVAVHAKQRGKGSTLRPRSGGRRGRGEVAAHSGAVRYRPTGATAFTGLAGIARIARCG
jgi:choline dehydrogenase